MAQQVNPFQRLRSNNNIKIIKLSFVEAFFFLAASRNSNLRVNMKFLFFVAILL